MQPPAVHVERIPVPRPDSQLIADEILRRQRRALGGASAFVRSSAGRCTRVAVNRALLGSTQKAHDQFAEELTRHGQ
jgi:hypothetical protein